MTLFFQARSLARHVIVTRLNTPALSGLRSLSKHVASAISQIVRRPSRPSLPHGAHSVCSLLIVYSSPSSPCVKKKKKDFKCDDGSNSEDSYDYTTGGPGYLHVGGVRKSGDACQRVADQMNGKLKSEVQCEFQGGSNSYKAYFISFGKDEKQKSHDNCADAVQKLNGQFSAGEFECKTEWDSVLLYVKGNCGSTANALMSVLNNESTYSVI